MDTQHHGDTFVDVTDYEQIIARTRAIIAHRTPGNECEHSPDMVAMHGQPLADRKLERQARIDALDVMSRRVTFDDVRDKHERNAEPA